MAGFLRQHSATNGCFWEAKLQRQLSSDDLEETFKPTSSAKRSSAVVLILPFTKASG